jgi:sugar lactone lactonase YvrE
MFYCLLRAQIRAGGEQTMTKQAHAILVFSAALLLIAASVASPGFAKKSEGELTVETMATLPEGEALEALTELPSGTIYFTVAAWTVNQTVWKISPGGQPEKFVDLPAHPLGLISTKDGFLLTAVTQHGDGTAPVSDYGGQVIVLNKSGVVSKVIHTDPRSFPNGITQARKVFLVADSFGGAIWRVNPSKKTMEPWLRDDLLAPVPGRRGSGANGLKALGDWVYVTNTSRGAMYRVKIDSKGRPASALALWAPVPVPDDFGIANDGTIYIPSNGKMLKISPQGEVSTFQEGVGASSAAIVSRDQHWLYWVTRGSGPAGIKLVPKMFRIRINP